MISLAELRKDYARGSLDETSVDSDPISQFQLWFQQALDAQLPEPNTMTLATADEHGRPSARILLIKGVDARGFVFYTNYESRKGHDLAVNPQASLLFYWIELERQVRVEGKVEKTSVDESDAYFASRPLGSRIGAWASEQSQPIADRSVLEHRYVEIERQYDGQPVPRPPHWGGYRLSPASIEFWKAGAWRLHDRWRYTRAAGGWRVERLNP